MSQLPSHNPHSLLRELVSAISALIAVLVLSAIIHVWLPQKPRQSEVPQSTEEATEQPGRETSNPGVTEANIETNANSPKEKPPKRKAKPSKRRSAPVKQSEYVVGNQGYQADGFTQNHVKP